MAKLLPKSAYLIYFGAPPTKPNQYKPNELAQLYPSGRLIHPSDQLSKLYTFKQHTHTQ